MPRPKKRPLNLPPLKGGADGPELRNMREAESNGQGSVLPSTREGQAAGNEPVGIFGPQAQTNPVESSARPVDLNEVTLTALLRRILQEPATKDRQDDPTRTMTNLEVIARGMVADAANGDKTMRELIVDRIEGKAVRAAQVQPIDTSLEEQLDKAAITELNKLTEPKEDK